MRRHDVVLGLDDGRPPRPHSRRHAVAEGRERDVARPDRNPAAEQRQAASRARDGVPRWPLDLLQERARGRHGPVRRRFVRGPQIDDADLDSLRERERQLCDRPRAAVGGRRRGRERGEQEDPPHVAPGHVGSRRSPRRATPPARSSTSPRKGRGPAVPGRRRCSSSACPSHAAWRQISAAFGGTSSARASRVTRAPTPSSSPRPKHRSNASARDE